MISFLTSGVKVDKALLKESCSESSFIRKASWLFGREIVKSNAIIYDRSDVSCFVKVEINNRTTQRYLIKAR